MRTAREVSSSCKMNANDPVERRLQDYPAAFDDMAVIPLAAQYFDQNIVAESMGFSVDAAGLPEKVQHLVDKYSVLEYIGCYEWHLMWHYAREYHGKMMPR